MKYEILLRNGLTKCALMSPLQTLSGGAIVPLTANKRDEAHADIYARRFWGRRQSAF